MVEEIHNKLNTYLRGSSKAGINQTLAEFMLIYLDRIPTLRASDIAERCHTSTPSVIRFCRELGYDGFADFKDAVETYLQNVEAKVLVPRAPLRVLDDDAAFAASIEQWTKLMQEYALCAMLALDRTQLLRLARDILHYKNVYVYAAGFSSLIAEELRLRLARSGKIMITASALHGELPTGEHKAHTLGVVISQHARIFSQNMAGSSFLRDLRSFCAKTWLITQEPSSRKFSVDDVLYVQADPSFEAEYHTMIYFEELLGEYCRALLERGDFAP